MIRRYLIIAAATTVAVIVLFVAGVVAVELLTTDSRAETQSINDHYHERTGDDLRAYVNHRDEEVRAAGIDELAQRVLGVVEHGVPEEPHIFMVGVHGYPNGYTMLSVRYVQEPDHPRAIRVREVWPGQNIKEHLYPLASDAEGPYQETYAQGLNLDAVRRHSPHNPELDSRWEEIRASSGRLEWDDLPPFPIAHPDDAVTFVSIIDGIGRESNAVRLRFWSIHEAE